MSRSITSHQTADLAYLAFRAAIGLLCRTLNASAPESLPPILLERIPAAKGCAPQVQMQLVLDAWDSCQRSYEANTPLHHCLMYCCLSELATLAEAGNDQHYAELLTGPKPLDHVDRLWLCSKVRTMQITWPFETDSAEFLRETGLLADEMDEIGVDDSPTGELLETLGRWKVNLRLPQSIGQLLSEKEIRQLQDLMSCHAFATA